MTAELGGLPDLRKVLRDQPQVLDKALVFARFGRLIGQAQQERRMHRDEALDALAQCRQPAPRTRNRRVAPGERTRGRRTERDREARLDELQLLVEPPAA